jgi:hypothetical protein
MPIVEGAFNTVNYLSTPEVATHAWHCEFNGALAAIVFVTIDRSSVVCKRPSERQRTLNN